MDRLRSTVRPYAWGSRSALARILGREPSGGPEAELWMGAHPSAPSVTTRDGVEAALDRWITNDPRGELGEESVRRFGPRLPFLVKVLAADEPLSIQAHPSLEQAAGGFAREEALGIPRTDPARRYVDASDKPEILIALEPFDALAGLREIEDAAGLARAFGVEEEVGFRAIGGSDHRAALAELFAAPPAEREALIARLASADPPGFAEEAALAKDLAARYPGDVGVAVALLLRRVKLSPGEALFLPPRVLHAYLRGAGLEVMASSDNVLRGGLTPKLVDAAELLRVIDTRPQASSFLRAPLPERHLERYVTPARAFEVSLLRPGGGELVLERRGPEIFVCIEGSVSVSRLEAPAADLSFARGEAVFVPYRDGALRLGGTGLVFRTEIPAEAC